MTAPATDDLADGKLLSLPAEAGDVNAVRFEPNDDWLRRAAPALQKTAMWRWFATRYDDPREAVPNEDGHFLYTDGGPFHADEVLHGRFDEVVPAEVIDELVASLQRSVGNDWALKPLDKSGG